MKKNTKRRGRPSKPVSRYPSGQPRHTTRTPRDETETQIMATVVNYRRKVVADEHVKRAEAGYELGRMMLAGIITPRLHRAGYDYARIVDDYQRAAGYPSPFPRSLDLGAARGLSLSEGISPERFRTLAGDYMRSQTVLADAGSAAIREVREVCIFDRPVISVENLRLGLLALADMMKVPLG